MKRTITMLVLMGLILVVGCEEKEAACSKTKAAGQCSLKQGCPKAGACKTAGKCAIKAPCKCPAGKCTCKKVCKKDGKCTVKPACKCPAGKCECKMPCGCKKGACKCKMPAATTPAKKACCGTCKK